ncbi:MAG: aldo/keto reductase [Streptococcaceae bacterium]|nr:aldo/keto reductase [Streptococcaceae bacterium]
MKNIKIGNSNLSGSQVVLGCMRMNDPKKDPVKVIQTAFDAGINFFDHADIYGAGKCEEIFAKALAQTSIQREDIIVQTKCGIRPGIAFDFSKKHIIDSVDASLKRLDMDYVDAMLLHRPDTLMDPEEVAQAFDELEKSGKVRHFGVSNQNPMQIELLKKYVKQPLIANQLQFGLMHTGMIDSGIHVNMTDAGSFDHDGSILEYSRLNDMTIQAWSPYQFGFFEGIFIGNEKFPKLNEMLDTMAEKYNVTPTGIATAWVNRHPANMQTIVGTMSPERIQEIAAASDIVLSREDWYALYMAAGNILP